MVWLIGHALYLTTAAAALNALHTSALRLNRSD